MLSLAKVEGTKAKESPTISYVSLHNQRLGDCVLIERNSAHKIRTATYSTVRRGAYF